MNIVTEKKCSKCKEVKSVNEFHQDKNRASGYTPACKSCHKKYYATNKVSIIERITKSYFENKQKKHDYDKKRRKEKIDEIKEKKHLYYEKNKSILNLKNKLYYLCHKESFTKSSKKWKRNNKEKVNEMTRARRAKIKGNGGFISADEWKSILSKYGNKCLKCGSTERIEMDHVIPIALGGINDASNVQPLCRNCNATKNDKIEDYR